MNCLDWLVIRFIAFFHSVNYKNIPISRLRYILLPVLNSQWRSYIYYSFHIYSDTRPIHVISSKCFYAWSNSHSSYCDEVFAYICILLSYLSIIYFLQPCITFQYVNVVDWSTPSPDATPLNHLCLLLNVVCLSWNSCQFVHTCASTFYLFYQKTINDVLEFSENFFPIS